MTEKPENAPDQSFPRKFRLGANRNYRHVYKRGRSFSATHFTLVYLKSRDLKIGFTVSKKVGNAVTRNRIRRWLREDIRKNRERMKAGRYIFIARPSAGHVDHATVTEDVMTMLNRAKAFKEDN